MVVAAAHDILGRAEEEPEFLTRQLITCLGNKRSLLGPIAAAVARVRRTTRRDHFRILDAFAGSGVVSRYLKAHATQLTVNDLEPYAAAAARSFLANSSQVAWGKVAAAVASLNAAVDGGADAAGFIERLYAPRDEEAIEPGERVFYTAANARRLDRFRRMLADLPAPVGDLLLGPLLSQASVHANTAGVFKGFYRDRTTGIGAFGGTGRDALGRIRGEITLEVPVTSRFECDVEIVTSDANELARSGRSFDIAYLDPPYNQHPYGSNYFMLNLLTTYREPTSVSPVAGIPTDWNRSAYNARRRAAGALACLVDDLDARFVLLAYNDEGHIPPEEIREILGRHGPVTESATRYHAFRGSRNLARRELHVTEHLYLLEKRR